MFAQLLAPKYSADGLTIKTGGSTTVWSSSRIFGSIRTVSVGSVSRRRPYLKAPLPDCKDKNFTS